MTSAITVANGLLDLAEAEGRNLTPLQLMKLVYIAQGWMLGIKGEPLFDERIEAWKYGPVIPALYNRTKRFGSGKIDGRLTPAAYAPGDALTEEQKSLLRAVMKNYGKYSGTALSNLTHRPSSPWSKVWNPDITGIEIPVDVIRAHYEQLKSSKVVTAA